MYTTERVSTSSHIINKIGKVDDIFHTNKKFPLKGMLMQF